MTVASAIVGAACVVATLVLVAAEKNEHARTRVVSKLFASAAFVGVGLVCLPLDSLVGRLVFAALVLSAVGDAFLLLASDRAFLFGLGAFLLAHVAYAVAFAARGVSAFAVEGAAFPAVIAGGIVLAWLLPRVPRPMRVPVVAYALVISAMVVLAAGTVAANGNAIIFVAALAFYVSDLAVARDRFVAPGFINRAWGLPLYYGAQLLFAAFAR